ncbi:hypothetical protein HDU76_001686 [Blyttiomyces sp. JEL0837]|nr:hypothetical protein HDU76_001686 [Blyttiomyces sp. JEL0837]
MIRNMYEGVAAKRFSKEAERILSYKVKPADLFVDEVKGWTYMKASRYHDILNKAFGEQGWKMECIAPLSFTPSKKVVYSTYVLRVHDRFVSEAVGDWRATATLPAMSEIEKLCEYAAMVRCCKDLGIAWELWDKTSVDALRARIAKEEWKQDEKGKKFKRWVLKPEFTLVPPWQHTLLQGQLSPQPPILNNPLQDLFGSSTPTHQSTTVSNKLADPISNMTLPTSSRIATGGPITVYLIYYGNFSDLEISRIDNYVSHLSDKETVPAVWTMASQFFDEVNGNVAPVLLYGGYVRDFSYSHGMNLTTMNSAKNYTASDEAGILVSNIGEGKPFPYDPLGFYFILTTPEVFNVDYNTITNKIPYGAYHGTNSLMIDGSMKPVNHAFAQTLGMDHSIFDHTTWANGETGRIVVDLLVDYIHHELFEALSDPYPGKGWVDRSGGLGETGDLCEHRRFPWPHISFTEDTQNSKGRWYNIIVNNVTYAIQDIWVFDKSGIQTCMSEVLDPIYSEYKAIREIDRKDLVTADMRTYWNDETIRIPCRAYYLNRHRGGYTTPDENICHTFYSGNSLRTGQPELAILDIPGNFHVLSRQFASYEWLKLNESNALLVKDTDLNPPLAPGNYTFVIIDDNFAFQWRNGVLVPLDQGVYYYCRAMINNMWYVGETRRTSSTCDLVVDGVITFVPKSDSGVEFLVKKFRGGKDQVKIGRPVKTTTITTTVTATKRHYTRTRVSGKETRF